MATGLQKVRELLTSGERHSVQHGEVLEVYADVDGVYAEVSMGAEQEPVVAEQVFPYAGKDFGMYPPLSKGDYIAVFLPDGDPTGRAFTFGVMNDADVTIPQDVLDNPDDFWLIMKEGQNVRIRTSGDTNEMSIVSKLIKLGSEDPDDRVVMWKELKTILDNFKSTFDQHTHIITVVSPDGDTATAAAPETGFDAAGNISNDKPASSVVKGIL